MALRDAFKGHCFLSSFCFMKVNKDDKNLRLVHGCPMYGGKEKKSIGKRLGHAWVERINPDTGERTIAFESNNPEFEGLPIIFFYTLGNMREEHVTRYTYKEASAQALTHEHVGPWNEYMVSRHEELLYSA